MTDLAIVKIVVDKNSKIIPLKNYLLKYKHYTGWISYLQFAFENLKKDLRLTKEEIQTVKQHTKLINRFRNSKRPLAYLRARFETFVPLLELAVKYEFQ